MGLAGKASHILRRKPLSVMQRILEQTRLLGALALLSLELYPFVTLKIDVVDVLVQILLNALTADMPASGDASSRLCLCRSNVHDLRGLRNGSGRAGKTSGSMTDIPRHAESAAPYISSNV